MSYYRRGYNWEQVEYVAAPVAGWNPDANPWEMAATQAPILDNALVRPGKISVRGGLVNWANLSAVASPVAPVNPTGIQPLFGSTALLIGRKALSATAFIDPWNAPIVRPAAASAIATADAGYITAVGGSSFSQTTPATAAYIPGPRGINYLGTRYYIGYVSSAGTPILDDSGSFYAANTNLLTASPSGALTLFTNTPSGALDIKSYQGRIFLLGGVDNPGGGTTFSPVKLFFTNPNLPAGGGNSASFADWKDPVQQTTNYITMDGDSTDPGVGLAVTRNALLIFRYRSVYKLTGTIITSGTSAGTASLSVVSRDVGCIDARSIVETDHGVYFMSKQGLMITDGTTTKNVSGLVTNTIQNAISVVLGAIKTGFGGHATCAVASDGKIVASLGLQASTAGTPNGSIQPVWCGVYDPNSGVWTRLTSTLFAGDGTIVTQGNNYPGIVFNTPDGRLLSIGDKYITQWEAETASSTLASLSGSNNPTAAANSAAIGVDAWSNASNAEVADGQYATATHVSGTTGVSSYCASYVGSGSPSPVVGSNGEWTDNGAGYMAAGFSNVPQTSNLLFITNPGFSIPSDAIIRGIGIAIPQYVAGSPNYYNVDGVELVNGGASLGGSVYGNGYVIPSSTALMFLGGEYDTWGVSNLTPAIVNSASFGVAYWTAGYSAGGLEIEYVEKNVQMDVWYDLPEQTEYLETSAYGFSVPTNATVTGIAVSVTRLASGAVSDTNVQLMKAGAVQATNRSAGAGWPGSSAVAVFGGPSDLWGTTWAPSDVNNAGFGAAVAASLLEAGTVSYVDLVAITVYYTVLGTTVQQSFVRSPGLYDMDQAGNYQPIPFNWTTRFLPIVGTTTLTRKFGQLKRWFIDYVFQGQSLPSTNGFSVTPINSSGTAINDTANPPNTKVLAITNNSTTPSSVSGGAPTQAISIQREDFDLPAEVSDLAFRVTWSDVQQSSQPSAVEAELHGLGIEYQPTRDLR